MMRTFGVDNYDEAMAVVYTTIDNEDWDWGREKMNALWRSWREHRRVSSCSSLIPPARELLTGHRTYGALLLVVVRARSVILSTVQPLLGTDNSEKLHAICFSEASWSGLQ